jgi:hypothetical protein
MTRITPSEGAFSEDCLYNTETVRVSIKDRSFPLQAGHEIFFQVTLGFILLSRLGWALRLFVGNGREDIPIPARIQQSLLRRRRIIAAKILEAVSRWDFLDYGYW